MIWARPSPAGRRLALERKIRLNVSAYGGAVRLVSLTPPGQDVLPYGDDGRVEWIHRTVWNTTSGARASRLFEAAQRSADRLLRAQGWTGKLPRQVGNAWGWQKRGLKHWHWLLPNETPAEKLWSRHIVRFMNQAWRSEELRWGKQGRWEILWSEFRGEKPPRGFYGFGFVDRKSGSNKGSEWAAGYLAKNAAGYVAGQGGGHYVSRELTRLTGVTMRALRACNYLFVRRLLIRKGELDDDWLPSCWTPEWTSEVLRVWNLIGAPQAP